MPKLPRRWSAGLIGFLFAACSSAAPGLSLPPSVTPSLDATPSVSPVTTTPGPTAVPTAGPSVAEVTFAPAPSTIAGCPTVDSIVPQSPFVSANGSIGKFGVDLLVTRIEQRSGQPVSVTPPTRALNNDGVGLVLGGHEVLLSPEYYYDGYNPPITMESATVTLTLDGAQPIALPVRFVPGNENYNQAAVAVPDIAGHGRLAVAMTWTDKCFRLEASGSLRVGVVPASTTAGCALDEDAYWKELESLFAHALSVDSREVRIGSPSNSAKYIPPGNPGIDAFIVYSFNKDDPAFTAAPGATLGVLATNPALTLTDMELGVYTRQSVARAVKDYPPFGTVLVLKRSPAQQADGSWRLRVPTEPGRYVATLAFQYDSKCSSGTAWAVLNIDVVQPAPPPT